MSNLNLTKIIYEELVRMVANAVGVSRWAEDPFENVRREMEEKITKCLMLWMRIGKICKRVSPSQIWTKFLKGTLQEWRFTQQ